MRDTRNYTIGLDIRGESVRLGILGTQVEPVWRGSAELKQNDPYGSFASIREALEDAGRRYPLGQIGIASEGMINMTEGTLRHPAFGEEPFPLREALSEAMGMPVWLDGPSFASMMAEWTSGACKGMDNALYLEIGDTVTGAMVTEGTLCRGKSGSAGALGHIITHAGGKECECGMRGCLNAYANINVLGEMCSRAPEAVMLLASDGDRSMRDMEHRYLSELAEGLSGLVAIFDPQAIVLGGFITRGGRYMLETLHRVLEEKAPAYMDGELLITYARHRVDGRVIGAAALADYYIPEEEDDEE